MSHLDALRLFVRGRTFKGFDPEVMAQPNLRRGHIGIFMLVVVAPVLEGRDNLLYSRDTNCPGRLGAIVTLPFLRYAINKYQKQGTGQFT
jgi:hypothetical protein